MVHSGIEGLLFLITQPDLIQDKHNLVFLSVTENKLKKVISLLNLLSEADST